MGITKLHIKLFCGELNSLDHKRCVMFMKITTTNRGSPEPETVDLDNEFLFSKKKTAHIECMQCNMELEFNYAIDFSSLR